MSYTILSITTPNYTVKYHIKTFDTEEDALVYLELLKTQYKDEYTTTGYLVSGHQDDFLFPTDAFKSGTILESLTRTSL